MNAPVLPENNKEANLFDSKAVFKRLLSYLWQHKGVVGISVIFLVCTALTEASFAALIEKIVNDGFVNAQEWHLKWLSLVLFSLLILRAVVGYFGNYFMAKLGRIVILIFDKIFSVI